MPANRRLLYAFEVLGRIALALIALAQPNRVFTNDAQNYGNRAYGLSIHHLPYINFLWEYPPLTTLPLAFMPLTGNSSGGFLALFVGSMIALEYSSLCLIRRHAPDRFAGITWYWSLVVIPLSFLVWFRLDYISVFAATVALVTLHHKRSSVVAIVLGYLAKLWPILILVALVARGRLRAAAIALGGCALVTFIWWAITPSGFLDFLRYRQGSGFQVESLPGSVLRLAGRNPHFVYQAFEVDDHGVHWLQNVMVALSVLVPVGFAVCAYRRRDRVNDVALAGASVGVVICLSRIISPQYLAWLVPFVVLVLPASRRLGYVFAIAVALSLVDVGLYRDVIHGTRLYATLLLTRNIFLVWTTVELALIAFAKQATSPQSPASLRP